MLSNEVFSINNNQESKSKKRLKLILLISIPIILIVIVVILVVVLIKKKSEDNPQSQFPETGIIYNFSTFFFLIQYHLLHVTKKIIGHHLTT